MPLATATITDAQMKALSSTPVTLIAAPGAGLRLTILGASVAGNIMTNGGTGVTGNVRFAVVNQVVAALGLIATGNNGEREGHVAGSTFSTMDNVLTNRAVEIVGTADAGATFATVGGSGFKIALWYEVMDDPN